MDSTTLRDLSRVPETFSSGVRGASGSIRAEDARATPSGERRSDRRLDHRER